MVIKLLYPHGALSVCQVLGLPGSARNVTFKDRLDRVRSKPSGEESINFGEKYIEVGGRFTRRWQCVNHFFHLTVRCMNKEDPWIKICTDVDAR